MKIKKLLIANRGEIAIRIARAASRLGIRTVAVYSADDALSLHCRRADQAVALGGNGVAAYLDMQRLIRIATEEGCDAVHPGYGFLSENHEFASLCKSSGIIFIGPDPTVLRLFGDKAAARQLALRMGVPVVAGTEKSTSLAEAIEFFDALGPNSAMMIKAISGGGGRGMRAVTSRDQIQEAYEQCQSEALAAFGNAALYVEQMITSARHIEVQIIGDGTGNVTHLWERECTVQRRHQKVIELAPSPTLPAEIRDQMTTAAVRMASEISYGGLGTFEFLLSTDDGSFVFMEANPRLQVEHTITEAVTGVDLVVAQIRVAAGESLQQLGLTQADISEPEGYAVQLRINMETMQEDGTTRPSGGVLRSFDVPTGPGIRVDTHGYTGYRSSLSFDSLLAKLVVHDATASFAEVMAEAYAALCEFHVQGVQTNIAFLQNLVSHPDVVANNVTTRFIEQHLPALLAHGSAHPQFFFEQSQDQAIDAADTKELKAPKGTEILAAPVQGTVVSMDLQEGDTVHAGQTVAIIEAMKMQYTVHAPFSGIVRLVVSAPGDLLNLDQSMAFIEPAEVDGEAQDAEEEVDLDHIRPDLAKVLAHQAALLDPARPEAVAKRHKLGHRTARENLADLFDSEDYMEYGGLTYAAQQGRHSVEELRRISPADGLITSIGHVNDGQFDAEATRCLALVYDYTVFAGTQGTMNHRKIDRALQLAEQWRLPIVVFAEGGGGRPGDLENHAVALLHTPTFLNFSRLSGLVPRISIVHGRCFAGNAALAGCADVIIATENATLGMAGPAMVEGGGLGTYKPEEIGPVDVQGPNGVMDIIVKDETAAVAAAKQYLSYFQGPLPEWSCRDQRELRHVVPENRVRAYDIYAVIDILADQGSVLELREQFGRGIITAFIRIEGRPMGLLANNPRHLGGAIDADAADKAARFMQLCDAFDIPILSLSDTPGFMVGPEAEATGMVRHVSRMFVTAASMTVPIFTVVLRKGYGLGAISMAGGSFHGTVFTVSWPSGEFGAMGIEGAVRLGYRKELEAIEDPALRQQHFEERVEAAYMHGSALNSAAFLEIDNVIDPAQTRQWISQGLKTVPAPPARTTKKRAFIDTW